MSSDADVVIIGGGISGLTLALFLHQKGIPCRVYEAVPEIKALGVGINLLPHATGKLARLGLLEELAAVAVETRQAVFYTRHGQHVYTEALGLAAGFPTPQFSIHRGDLQLVLLRAARGRLGEDRVVTAHRCTGVESDLDGVTIGFDDPRDGRVHDSVRGAVAIACDGINSALRRQFYPNEGPPIYSGVNMWRGITRHPPILDGRSLVRIGWLASGKLILYPIRNAIDEAGNQLVNWVAEIETEAHTQRDWNRTGKLEDFMPWFQDWRFDFLDVPAFITSADQILEFPMVDQDPLPRWTHGRATLLGDAAHPMYPRGSNGAGQAILDAAAMAECLASEGVGEAALHAYEAIRRGPTSEVVLMNRRNPPDTILREVYLRTGDTPFGRIEDVITREEMVALSDAYKVVTGSDKATLAR